LPPLGGPRTAGDIVTRIQTHTIDDAPGPARPLLAGVVKTSPTGKLLNLHAQMAHSPVVLVAYAAIRKATETYGTLEPQVRSALMLTTAGVTHSEYAQALTSFLAWRSGWGPAEIVALRDGQGVGDEKVDALVGVVRAAAGRSGRVSEASWHRATASGWDSEQLTEAFSYLALTVFTGYFLNYAQTPLDLPSVPAGQE
jgi:alkylhydroperoxidase family enzyme